MTKTDLNAAVENVVDDITAAQESQEEHGRRAFLAGLLDDQNTEDFHKLESFRLGLVENRCRERLDSLQHA